MSAFDWIALTVLAASLLLGAWRGLVFELLSIAGWVCAFVAARWAAEPVGVLLPMGAAPDGLRSAAGWVLVFVAVAFLCGVLATLARHAMHRLGARPVDRVFGAAFGTLRGLLLLLLATLLVRLTPLREQDWWHASLAGPWLEIALANLQPLLPESLGRYLSA